MVISNSLELHFKFRSKLQHLRFYKSLADFNFPLVKDPVVAMIKRQDAKFTLVDKSFQKISIPDSYGKRNQYLFGSDAFLICNSEDGNSRGFTFNFSDMLKKELIGSPLRENV